METKNEKLIREIVENYTKEQIISALLLLPQSYFLGEWYVLLSESYYGDFLEYYEIDQLADQLAEVLIDLANETDFTPLELLDGWLGEGF